VSTSLNDPDDAHASDKEDVLAVFSDIADGGFSSAQACVDGELEPLILHRDGARACAWVNNCPHAHRRLDWAPGKFLKSKEGLLVCAVHGASFELGEGACVAGPCRGEHLRAVAVEVRDNTVVLVRDKDPLRS
jgi:nitrite reductase/ring-hydroxylating ferredoxin subunit